MFGRERRTIRRLGPGNCWVYTQFICLTCFRLDLWARLRRRMVVVKDVDVWSKPEQGQVSVGPKLSNNWFLLSVEYLIRDIYWDAYQGSHNPASICWNTKYKHHKPGPPRWGRHLQVPTLHCRKQYIFQWLQSLDNAARRRVSLGMVTSITESLIMGFW